MSGSVADSKLRAATCARPESHPFVGTERTVLPGQWRLRLRDAVCRLTGHTLLPADSHGKARCGRCFKSCQSGQSSAKPGDAASVLLKLEPNCLDKRLAQWASRQRDELVNDITEIPSHRSVELIEVDADDLAALVGERQLGCSPDLVGNRDRLLLTESEANEIGLSLELQLSTSRIAVTPRQLVATWRFPTSPLITVDLGGVRLAVVDYVAHSASLRWALSAVETGRAPIGLQAMVARVPEEVDSDPALRTFALDTALLSATEVLIGRQARLSPIDQ